MSLHLFFSDGTKEYRNPVDLKTGETVTIRFRVPAGCAACPKLHTEKCEVLMRLVEAGEKFDYYASKLLMGKKQAWYYFSFTYEGKTYYYDRSGVTENLNREFYFLLTPEFSVPEWAKGAVMYQIYTDRFCNGDSQNDVVDGNTAILVPGWSMWTTGMLR